MHKYLSILSALIVLAGCNIQEPGRDSAKVSFTATQETDGGSKTSLSSNHVLWSAADEISVFSSTVTAGERFAIAPDDAGKGTAKFSGNSVGNGPYYALYPAGTASMSGSVLSLSLPATQAYAEGSFASGSSPAVAATSGTDFQFKNLCGLLSVRLTGSTTVTSISITSNKSEALWGAATVDMGYSDVPSLVMAAPATEDNRTLTLDCGSGVELSSAPTEFIFVVPAGSLSEGFTLKVSDNCSAEMVKKTASNANIVRSVLSPMSAIAYVETASPFLNLTNYGVYDLSGAAPVAVKQYVKGTDQLALRSYANGSYTFRIQSLATKSALLVSMPYNVTEGAACSLKLESIGSTGVADGTVTASLLKADDGRLWFKDNTNNRGYIIADKL